ncbi:hypothetical protein [Polluticoccus soli]|uniref:hypothetical protein n=1 Tax=Polluticoccus soli TaxID=3034150 RepID=UPI0023E2B453|nr:hypothetical protein [Flavipsychrobacter sp. JY13-12]
MRLLLLIAFVFISGSVAGQEIARNETDKYLKVKVKETTWEALAMPFKNALRFRCKMLDDRLYVEFRVTLHQAFRVDEGDEVYLLLDNDESVPVICVRGGVANYDYAPSASFWYGDYLYKITDEQKQKFLEHKVVGARVDVGGEYVTFDKVKEKNAIKFQKALTLVTQ